MRAPTALALPVAFSLIWFVGMAPKPVPTQDDPILRPFDLDDIYVPVPAAAQLLVANPAHEGEEMELLSVTVTGPYGVIEQRSLTETLAGDPDYVRLHSMLDRLPADLVHKHGDGGHFADEEECSPAEARRALEGYWRLLKVVSERWEDPDTRPYYAVDLTIPYDQVFAPEDPAGTEVDLDWTLHWRDAAGNVRSTQTRTSVQYRGPRLDFASFGAEGTPAGSGGITVHRGDLHVHSCHGEAVGACSPSANCTAETLQVSGSFSYAQLKSQYQALGMDWYTATDHSYCINSTSEYDVIKNEIAAINDASFLCMPDIELSSDETGPQSGSDAGDALCLGFTSQNHMGAHGIHTRIEGGSDGLFGFCSGLMDFTDSINEVNNQGGWTIAHHPAGSSFAWNSVSSTVGQEAGSLHGVEIWNGASQSGQGGNVASWVNWLLDGRVLYAYSGSDTHDEAHDFGANHALVEGDFTPENLEAALRAGRVYISNGPALNLEAQLGHAIIPMGDHVAVSDPVPNALAQVRATVNLGGDTGTVTIFRGRVGDANETMIGTSTPQTGSFTYEINVTLSDGLSYYRAYVEAANGSKTAYSNPIFFDQVTGDPAAYCVGKENSAGCVPSIQSAGTPSASAGFGFFLSAQDVRNNQFGILVYAYQPGLLPFSDSVLCLSGSLYRTPIQSSGGNVLPDCSGNFAIDFNGVIASGLDPSLTAGTTVFSQYWYRDPQSPSTTGLTDAMQFTIQP